MKVLLNVCCNEPESWSGYALVEISAEGVKEILAWRELFQMVKSKASELSFLAFDDARCAFLEDLDVEAFLTQKEQDQLETREFFVLPEGREISSHVTETVCDRIHISENGVYWESLVEDEPWTVSTQTLMYALFTE